QEENVLEEPINLQFCYGINESYSSVHAINIEKTNNEYDNDNDNSQNVKHELVVIYSSDNNIVMVEGKKKQILFRGHLNKITKVIKSYNNKYIVSCDQGNKSCIILWKVINNLLVLINKFYFSYKQDKSSKNYLSLTLDMDQKGTTNVNDKEALHVKLHNENIIAKTKTGKNTGVSIETDINAITSEDNDTDNLTEHNDDIGYECVDISYDNKYICAVTEPKLYTKSNEQNLKKKKNTQFSVNNNVYVQKIIVFDVNSVDNKIVCIDQVYGKKKQKNIRFSRKCEIITNSSSKLYIYNFDKTKRTISHYSPSLYKSNKINERIIFTETSFVDNSTAIITGTKHGHLIIWDYSSIFLNKTKQTIKQREYQKILEINKNVSINNVLSYGNFIILGMNNGNIQIYDNELKCYAWFENKELGSIKSLSFTFSNYDQDFFLWNSFIFFTDKNIIKKICPSTFNNGTSLTEEELLMAGSVSTTSKCTTNMSTTNMSTTNMSTTNMSTTNMSTTNMSTTNMSTTNMST
ncbi:WD repeat-containing protein 66, putative, partial [Hepatocystis sp. ex Piliocolobus tephrosceles]